MRIEVDTRRRKPEGNRFDSHVDSSLLFFFVFFSFLFSLIFFFVCLKYRLLSRVTSMAIITLVILDII